MLLDISVNAVIRFNAVDCGAFGRYVYADCVCIVSFNQVENLRYSNCFRISVGNLFERKYYMPLKIY